MNALKTLKIGFSIITLLFFCVALSCDNDQSDADKQGNPGIEVPDGEFWAIDFEFDNSELVVLYSDYSLGFDSGIGRFKKMGGNWELIHWISADSIEGGLSFAHTMSLTQNGYLISDSMADRSIEIDDKGQILQEYFGIYINEAMPTSDGVIVTSSNLATTEGCNLRIFDNVGEILWDYYPILDYPNAVTSQLHNGSMLPDGNVLMAISPPSDSGIILEVNQQKDIIWEFIHEDLFWPRNAVRLENGNTLIAYYDGLWEVDINGQIVWEFVQPEGIEDGPEGGAMFNVTRLDDGITVAVLDGDIAWIDSEGTIIDRFSFGDKKTSLNSEMRKTFGSMPYL